ncbi:ribonuclease P protein component [soil metagenome]
MGLRRGTRLTDSPEFERVYKQGTAYRGKLFSVHAFPREAGGSRLGLSVSKKVGNAVVRNSVKRRLREVFRSRLPEIRDGWDFVISARPAAAGVDYRDLDTEFGRALKRLGDHS